MTVSGETERTSEEMAVVCFKVLSWHMFGGNEKTIKYFSQNSQCPSQDAKWALLKHESLKCYHLNQLSYVKNKRLNICGTNIKG
jgi:hypothetical protein